MLCVANELEKVAFLDLLAMLTLGRIFLQNISKFSTLQALVPDTMDGRIIVAANIFHASLISRGRVSLEDNYSLIMKVSLVLPYRMLRVFNGLLTLPKL